MKFLCVNVHEINPNFVVIVHQKLMGLMMAKAQKSGSTFNKHLNWIYYISSSLASGKKEELNPLNVKQRDALLKKLREFTINHVINPFCENSKLTIQHIIYDKNVTQHFNSSVFNTNFESLEYLLPILDNLGVLITPNIEKNIILQFPRCVKRWHGEILVQNLLILDKFKIHAPEIFELATPNLFSCFTFYFDMQNLVLNKDILNESKAAQLLKAYINQKEK